MPSTTLEDDDDDTWSTNYKQVDSCGCVPKTNTYSLEFKGWWFLAKRTSVFSFSPLVVFVELVLRRVYPFYKVHSTVSFHVLLLDPSSDFVKGSKEGFARPGNQTTVLVSK